MSYRYHPAESPVETIVLLHGFVASQKYWRRLIPRLTASRYNVLSIDLLGFGSSKLSGGLWYDYEEHMAHIEACIRTSGVKGRYVLVGHSMGALVAARFSQYNSSNIKKVVLLHPPLYSSAYEGWETLLATGKLYRFLLTSRLRSIAWGILKCTPGVFSNHSGIARERSLHRIVLSESNLSTIGDPAVDTLLVIGKKDRPIYQQNAEQFRGGSTRLYVIVLDVDHHSPVKHPRKVSELIHSFI